MGATSSIHLEEQDYIQIREETGFADTQIRHLFSRFNHLDKGSKGYLTRKDLMLIPDLAVNPLATRIIDVILLDENDPSQSLEEINFRQFVKVLACFRKISPSQSHQANSVDKKLEFIFKIYDKDGDGKISKDDLSHILSCLVGLNIPQEQVNQIVSRTMKEADLDKDNHLDFEEFKRALGDVEIGDKMSFQFSRTI